MKKSGRFDTSTKTKILTEFGTILKVDIYKDGYHFEEYRIRPVCSHCNGKMDCVCYSEDNCEEPYEYAIGDLQKRWTCTKPDCVVDYVRTDDPEYYKDLIAKHGNDKWSMAQDIMDDWSEMDEGEFCNI